MPYKIFRTDLCDQQVQEHRFELVSFVSHLPGLSWVQDHLESLSYRSMFLILFYLPFYPPAKTVPDPVATELPQATGSPILPNCILFANTVLDPDASVLA